MGNGSPALLEGFENPFQQALFHTDAGIAHDELEIGAIAHSPGFPDAEVHAAPFRGKFQRIGQNIDKHLIEAQGIAPVALVHHAFDVQVKDNVLVFRLRIDERTDALHERPEIEFFIDDGYLTALDARHVQNVVDQREEVTGRKEVGFGTAGLFRRGQGVLDDLPVPFRLAFLFLLLQHQLGDVEDIGEHVFAVVIITVQGHVPCLVGRGAVGIHRVLDGA